MPQLHESCLQRAQSTQILHERDAESLVNETEIESSIDSESEQSPQVHVLALLKRKTIQFSTFCEIEQKWEKSCKKIDLIQAIESFRDAIMIPVNKMIVILNMRNSVLSQAQNLSLETAAIESIKLPNDVECAGLALFCQLNDEIYCFARSDQHFFHK